MNDIGVTVLHERSWERDLKSIALAFLIKI
jgi:hypothetical protein